MVDSSPFVNTHRFFLCALGLAALTTGCNVCADLDERMCADLGAEDCKLWKEQGMNFEAQAKSRGGRRNFVKSLFFGDDATTCEMSGKDPTYGTILDSTKKALEAVRKSKAASAAIQE